MLGIVDQGTLRPLAEVDGISRHGIALLTCEQCGQQRQWRPASMAGAGGPLPGEVAAKA
jgi:hypothetical protein